MRIKRIVSVLTALAMAAPYVAYAADPPAAAEAAAQDVLFKNGSKARGQVVDIVPGDHVTLKMKTGETRRFDWKDVDRVVPASGPEPPPLAPVATAPATTATTAPTVTVAPTATTPPPAGTTEILPPVSGPTARVHINSPSPAFLFRKAPGMTSYQKACDAPCDREMPLSDDYQVSGSGLKAVNFRLNAQAGQTVVIECDPASEGGKIGGVVLIVLGALGLTVGAPVLLIGLVAEGASSSTDSSHSGADAVLIVGLVISGVSLGLGIGGVVVLVKSGDSGATQHVGFLNGLPDTTKTDDRYVRAPVWHAPVVTEKQQAAGTTPVMIPIFSRSF